MYNYIINVLVGFDQFVNSIFGGEPDETISYRSAIDAKNGYMFGCIMCKFLSFFQKNHCEDTVENLDKRRLLLGAAVARGDQPV